MKKILSLIAALLLSTQAQAVQISSAGDSWTMNYLVDASSTAGLSSNLTATSNWLVTSFTSTSITLDISITNTTTLTSLLTNADITTFGFGVSPNASATILTAGSTFGMVGSGSGKQQTFPGGFKGIDICIFAQGCAGGSVNTGLHAGDTDSIQLMLTGNFSGGFADLLFFPVKFQTNQGSYHPGGTIPEPPVLSLLVVGLFGMGIVTLRRRMTA